MSETPKLRNATESVGWLNSQGPLDVSPAPVEGAETPKCPHGAWATPDTCVSCLRAKVSSLQQQLAEARKENMDRERIQKELSDHAMQLAAEGIKALERAEQAEAALEEWKSDFDSLMAHHAATENDLARLQAAQAWHPIETAPKDGTPVFLLFTGEEMAPSGAHRARWCDGAYQGWWMEGHHCGGQLSDVWDQPTHWMPLPPAPTDAPAEKEPNR